uniref:BPTI/Kunitz inhibitor domain-containing protein n=1 Tax=Dicentrarchus labrax TaxID=13489 RepID=A0A8C4GEX9_DICLA
MGSKSIDLCSLLVVSIVDGNKLIVSVSFSPVDPCAAAPVVGPCKGTFPRWYYDRNAGECKHFLYGGCQGNHNNFLQESDCVSECIQKSENLLLVTFFFFLNLIL